MFTPVTIMRKMTTELQYNTVKITVNLQQNDCGCDDVGCLGDGGGMFVMLEKVVQCVCVCVCV